MPRVDRRMFWRWRSVRCLDLIKAYRRRQLIYCKPELEQTHILADQAA